MSRREGAAIVIGQKKEIQHGDDRRSDNRRAGHTAIIHTASAERSIASRAQCLPDGFW